MWFISFIGYSAAVVGALIMLPQLMKSIKTKSVGDISIAMLIIYLINCMLWVVYGSLIKSWPLILSNSVVFVIVLFEFILKLRYS